jgi:hypothetical protein
MELYNVKEFPDNYTQKVVAVLSAMSITGMKKLVLVGSASMRSQIYAGDYDAIEKVRFTSAEDIKSKLRDAIKKLRVLPETYIGDIKCGEEMDWSVFRPNSRVEDGKVKDFFVQESKTKIDELRSKNILTSAEAKESINILNDADTALEFLQAKKTLKFSVLRWTPTDILNGFLQYRGYRFELDDAIESGGMLKLDVISNINDRFTEFSVIYDLVDKKGRRLTNVPSNIIRSLQEDVFYYSDTEPFKALKRMFALAKAEKKYKVAELLVPILNSDLGRLYQIIGDLKTLYYLLRRPMKPIEDIRQQLDEMKARFSNIYLLRDFLKHEHEIIGWIQTILKTTPSMIDDKLKMLINKLQVILNKSTLKMMSNIENKLK